MELLFQQCLEFATLSARKPRVPDAFGSAVLRIAGEQACNVGDLGWPLTCKQRGCKPPPLEQLRAANAVIHSELPQVERTQTATVSDA